MVGLISGADLPVSSGSCSRICEEAPEGTCQAEEQGSTAPSLHDHEGQCRESAQFIQ